MLFTLHLMSQSVSQSESQTWDFSSWSPCSQAVWGRRRASGLGKTWVDWAGGWAGGWSCMEDVGPEPLVELELTPELELESWEETGAGPGPRPAQGPGQSSSGWARLGSHLAVMFSSWTLRHWVFSLPCSGGEKSSFCLYFPAIQSWNIYINKLPG